MAALLFCDLRTWPIGGIHLVLLSSCSLMTYCLETQWVVLGSRILISTRRQKAV